MKTSILILLLFTVAADPTTLKCERGHYRPRGACHLHRAVVLPNSTIQLPLTNVEDDAYFQAVTELWDLKLEETTTTDCTITHDGPIVAFTFYYHYGHGNYYHFVYDTLIPLFTMLEQKKMLDKGGDGSESAELWPTVEHGNLPGMVPGVDWNTNAFDAAGASPQLPYWHSSLLSLFPTFRVRPLTRAEWPLSTEVQHPLLLSSSTTAAAAAVPPPAAPVAPPPAAAAGTVCVRDIMLGLPQTDHSNPIIIDRYVAYVQRRFSISPPSSPPSIQLQCDSLRAGFVRRSNRRRIVNHQELLQIMERDIPVDELRLETMTMREQVSSMKKYSVLVGMQGAGLMNGMFLSKAAHVIVLFQYNAASDSFAELLRPRLASYKRWINHNLTNSFNDEEKDPYHDIANTVVNIEEFELLWKLEMDSMTSECVGERRGGSVEL